MPSGYPGSTPSCSVENCSKKARRNGQCDTHWKQFLRENKPEFRENERRQRVNWRNKNIEYARQRERNYMPTWRKKQKDICYVAYGGYTCVCCGITEPKFLTLDHINNDGKQNRKEFGVGGGHLYRWIINHNFPPMFQVLCFNCNNGRALNGGICPHKETK